MLSFSFLFLFQFFIRVSVSYSTMKIWILPPFPGKIDISLSLSHLLSSRSDSSRFNHPPHLQLRFFSLPSFNSISSNLDICTSLVLQLLPLGLSISFLPVGEFLPLIEGKLKKISHPRLVWKGSEKENRKMKFFKHFLTFSSHFLSWKFSLYEW